jgi:hypothetical protein
MVGLFYVETRSSLTRMHTSGPCSSRSSACEAGAREVSQEACWKSAVDAQSGRTYYYEVKTREVAWELRTGGATVAANVLLMCC